MLSSEVLEAGLHGLIASDGARRVHKDTLIILDPSDVQKPYARKMEYLAKVWDGSRGEVDDNPGYWGCMAVACESGGRRPVPLHFRLWSADSPKERYVRSWKRKWMCDELAWECRMRYREVVEGYITRWRAEDTNPPRQAVLRAGGHAPV